MRFEQRFAVAAGFLVGSILLAVTVGVARADDGCPLLSSAPSAGCSVAALRCAVATLETEMRTTMQADYASRGEVMHDPARRYVEALNALRECQRASSAPLDWCWPKDEFYLHVDFGALGTAERSLPFTEVKGKCQYGVPEPIPSEAVSDCDENFHDLNTRAAAGALKSRVATLFARQQWPAESDFTAYVAALNLRNACRKTHDPKARPDCALAVGLELEAPLAPSGLTQSMPLPVHWSDASGACAYQPDPNPDCPELSLRNDQLSFRQRQIPGKKPGCSSSVSYGFTDPEGIVGTRSLKVDDHGEIFFAWSRNLDGVSVSRSIIVSEYIHFPRTSTRPSRVETIDDHSELVISASGGREFRFAMDGTLLSYSGAEGFRQDFNFDPKAHGPFELGIPTSGILLDLGSKMGESPALVQTALSTFKDPFGNVCAVKNSELFRYVNQGDLEIYFKFETDDAMKTFLATRCPHLNLAAFL